MLIVQQIPSQSTFELLSILLGKQTARLVYRGKLNSLFDKTSDSSASRKCEAARELVKRWLDEELQASPVLENPEAVKSFLKIHFAGRQFESFVVLFLNAQNHLIAADELFRGTLTQTSVYPREIVKAALEKNAASLIFAHNHPSGSPSPSRADERLTQTLKSALSLVDVRVIDHFVVAHCAIVSMAEMGLV